ncbi:MAG: hypothetical protein KGO05_10145 [Chloroflexota bacterium]|nr:hypothetical protein [Chloroflexota bacterium]
MIGDADGGAALSAPTNPTLFSAWLADALGRPLTLVALRRADGPAEPLAAWREGLAAYSGVRLLTETLDDAPDAAALSRIAQRDPDALLICEDARDASGAPTPGAWRAAIIDAAEGLNLFERMLLAWCGVGVTRTSARAAGYEEGFAPDDPLPATLATLAREALARESYRRKGSSPPCYL